MIWSGRERRLSSLLSKSIWLDLIWLIRNGDRSPKLSNQLGHQTTMKHSACKYIFLELPKFYKPVNSKLWLVDLLWYKKRVVIFLKALFHFIFPVLLETRIQFASTSFTLRSKTIAPLEIIASLEFPSCNSKTSKTRWVQDNQFVFVYIRKNMSWTHTNVASTFYIAKYSFVPFIGIYFSKVNMKLFFCSNLVQLGHFRPFLNPSSPLWDIWWHWGGTEHFRRLWIQIPPTLNYNIFTHLNLTERTYWIFEKILRCN